MLTDDILNEVDISGGLRDKEEQYNDNNNKDKDNNTQIINSIYNKRIYNQLILKRPNGNNGKKE